MKNKICDERTDLGVQLIQHGKNKFTVVYHRQVKAGLTYSEAALEYGAAVMHALTCDGKLD